MSKPNKTRRSEIEQRRIDQVKPYEKNPRKNEAAVDAVAASIREFGFRQPILVDGAGVIITGHTRWKAAKVLGMKTVPVMVAKDLTPAQVRAYRLADNRLGEIAEWDPELLAAELKDLEELDLDLGLLGFTDREIGELMDTAGTGGLTAPDDVPDRPAEARTKRGDLWRLGEHRLLCGDSTRAEDVERLMGKERAALVATDPPYFIDYDPKRGRPGEGGERQAPGTYQEIDEDAARETLRKVMELALGHARENPAVYVWYAHRRRGLIDQVFKETGLLLHQVIVWVKPTVLLSHCVFAGRHEPCAFGWRKGKRPRLVASAVSNTMGTAWPVDLARSGEKEEPEYYQDVWALDWEGSGRAREKGHPTVKPVEVFGIPMRMHTRKGEVCFEPFSGSGSQIIAAERLGRRCYAIEIEPVFVDVAVRRWEDFTGGKAKREGKR